MSRASQADRGAMLSVHRDLLAPAGPFLQLGRSLNMLPHMDFLTLPNFEGFSS